MAEKRRKFRKNAIIKGGFKCDADGCDYQEEAVPMDFEYLDEYIEYMKSYFDKKCPKCGAPLLIPGDYEQMLSLVLLFHNPVFIAIENLIGLFTGIKKHRVIAGVNKEHNLEFEVKEEI